MATLFIVISFALVLVGPTLAEKVAVWLHMGPAFAWTWKILQWPVVFGPRSARFGWWVESSLAPRVYRRTSYVAVSDSTRRELVALGVDADRITIIHNGTDAVADAEAERAPLPRVVVLGRLVPQKRVEIALDAVDGLNADVARMIR